MPEWGQVPIPKKLLAQGVTDMVRVSDARMSGTAFGTVVLHVAPESAVGGPLARGARRRPDRPRRRGAADRSRRPGRARSSAASPSSATPAPRYRARLRRALPRARAAGRRGLRLRLPARASRRAGRERAARPAQRLGRRLVIATRASPCRARRRPALSAANASPKSLEREAMRHDRARADAAGVQQRDDAAPGGGRVAEARGERQVVVDEQVGRQLEQLSRSAAGRAAARGRRGAPSRRRASSPRVAPAASMTRSNARSAIGVVGRERGRAGGERELLLLGRGGRARRSRPATRGAARCAASSAIVPSPITSMRSPGRGRRLLEAAHDDGRRLDQRGVEQRDVGREHVHEPRRHDDLVARAALAREAELVVGLARRSSRPTRQRAQCPHGMMHSATHAIAGRDARRRPRRPPRRRPTTRARASADSGRTPGRRARAAARGRCRRDRRRRARSTTSPGPGSSSARSTQRDRGRAARRRARASCRAIASAARRAAPRSAPAWSRIVPPSSCSRQSGQVELQAGHADRAGAAARVVEHDRRADAEDAVDVLLVVERVALRARRRRARAAARRPR